MFKTSKSPYILSSHLSFSSSSSFQMYNCISRSFCTSMKYLHALRRNTYDVAKSFIVEQYDDILAHHVTSIVAYETKNARSENLYWMSYLDIIWALILKHMCKDNQSVSKFLEFNVKDFLKQKEDSPDRIYKVTFGSGKIIVVRSPDVCSTDVCSTVVDKVGNDVDVPFVSVNYGSIPLDGFLKKLMKGVAKVNSLTARDVLVMYILDEMSKWFNWAHIRKIMNVLLTQSFSIQYFDQNFEELEYKESDIVL